MMNDGEHLPRVKGVSPGGRPLSLDVVWQDDARATVDFSGPVARLEAFAPLEDPALFATARPAHGGTAVAWGEVLDEEDGEGPIDVGADQLWRMAGQQSGLLMPEGAFALWRARMGYTLDEAAAALGLSRRMVAYYDGGAYPVPKTVWLATQALEHLGEKTG